MDRNKSVLARSSARAAAPRAPALMDHIPTERKLGSRRKDILEIEKKEDDVNALTRQQECDLAKCRAQPGSHQVARGKGQGEPRKQTGD